MSDEVQRSLGRIEGKLDSLADAMTAHFDKDEMEFGAIKRDINKINKKMFFGSGAIAAITSMVTLWIKGH